MLLDARFQQISERAINIVEVIIFTESGCNPKEGEYNMTLDSFIGSLDLSSHGGVDDISLIKEGIEEGVDFDSLPEEGATQIILAEDGEWEDVFWHKWYTVIRTQRIMF